MKKDDFKSFSEDNDILNYFEEFNKEVESNSDRGIVLICGSIIDQLLADLLESFLIENDKLHKDLFKPGKALGTFDNKKSMVFYLGLISEYEFQSISRLQKIRNVFAHEVRNVSFSHQSIKDTCSHLSIPKNSFFDEKIPLPKEEFDEFPKVDLNPIKQDTSAKDRFMIVFKYIAISLTLRTTIENLGKREIYTKNYTAEEAQTLTYNKLKENLDEVLRSREQSLEMLEEKLALLERISDLSGEEEEQEIQETKLKIQELESDMQKTKERYQPLINLNDYVVKVIKNSYE